MRHIPDVRQDVHEGRHGQTGAGMLADVDKNVQARLRCQYNFVEDVLLFPHRQPQLSAPGQGVAVDLVVGGIDHKHDGAVGPEAARVIVGVIQFDVLRLVACAVGHAVGINVAVFGVGHPHRRAIGPDALRVVIVDRGGVELPARGEAVAAVRLAVVGQDLVVPTETVLRHPEGLDQAGNAVQFAPNAPGTTVTAVKRKAPARNVGLVRDGVGIDPFVLAVDHPHGGAVRPDAARVQVVGRGLVCVQAVEVARGGIRAVGAAVSIDLVVRSAVILRHPDCFVAGPDAPGLVVAAGQVGRGRQQEQAGDFVLGDGDGHAVCGDPGVAGRTAYAMAEGDGIVGHRVIVLARAERDDLGHIPARGREGQGDGRHREIGRLVAADDDGHLRGRLHVKDHTVVRVPAFKDADRGRRNRHPIGEIAVFYGNDLLHRRQIGVGARAADAVPERYTLVLVVFVLGRGDRDGAGRVPVTGREGEAVRRHAEVCAGVAVHVDRDRAGRRRGQNDRVAGALPLEHGQRAGRKHHAGQRQVGEGGRVVARQVLNWVDSAPGRHRVFERGDDAVWHGRGERERQRLPADGDAADRRGRASAHGQRKGRRRRRHVLVERLAPVQRHGVPVHAGAERDRAHAVHFVAAERRHRRVAVEQRAGVCFQVYQVSGIRARREAHAVGIPVVLLNGVTESPYKGIGPVKSNK